jgi:small subunit ribosomal protein S20
MANHKSSIKRIRQTEKRKLHNRYYAKTARNAVRKLRATTEKAVATELLPKISSMLDKLAKRNIIHKNKASNLKSKLTLHVNKLA